MKKFKKIEISKTDLNSLFPEHDDACDVCESMPWCVIDICVKTRKARGLLCEKCKNLLVWANDDTEMLKRAKEHVKS